jgi:hypothetical protein
MLRQAPSLHAHVVNSLSEQTVARFSRQFQDLQDRPLLHTAKVSRSAHAVAFHKAVQNHADLFLRESDIRPERLLLRLREPLSALLALPALNPIPAVESGLHHLQSAVVAGHFGLAFLRALSQNDSGCRNPAFGLGPRLSPASS